MVECGRGCHLPVQSALDGYKESFLTQYVSFNMISGENAVPCLQPQGGCVPGTQPSCPFRTLLEVVNMALHPHH